MAKAVHWDFRMELSGITPDDLSMARLAEYLTELAGLLGKNSRPLFKGVVKGSAVLRAAVPPLERAPVSVRVRNATNDGEAAPYLTRIEDMLAVDGITRARVTDRKGTVLALVVPKQRIAMPEVTMHDVADIDGCVVRVEGRDRTAHIGLVEYGTERLVSVQTTDANLAQELAHHFRRNHVRLHTEGTWRRTQEGYWEPKAVTVLSFEVLDRSPATAILEELAKMPGNGWAAMSKEDALGEWRRLRGIERQPSAAAIRSGTRG